MGSVGAKMSVSSAVRYLSVLSKVTSLNVNLLSHFAPIHDGLPVKLARRSSGLLFLRGCRQREVL